MSRVMSEGGRQGLTDASANGSRADRFLANPLSLLVPIVLLLVLFFYAAIEGYRGLNLVVYSLGSVTLALGLLPIAINNSFAWSKGHVLISLLALIYASYFGIPALARYAPVSGGVVPGSMGDRFVFPGEVIDAQIVALIGFVSLLAAYANPVLAQAVSRIRPSVWDWTPRATMMVAMGMLGMGWTISILLSSSAVAQVLGTGFISTLASAQVFGVVLLVLLWDRYRSVSALVVIALVVPMSTLFGFFSGSKREALNALAIVFLTFMVLRGRIGWRWIALGVIALALLYPLNRYYQDYLIGSSRASAVEVLTNPQRVVSSLGRFLSDTDLSEHLAAGLESLSLRIDALGVNTVIISDTPRVVPFQKGRTLALFFIAPIPRIFWPGKPTFTVGQWVTDNYSHGLDTRTAPTQIGEFYFNFGIPGVIGGMLLLGTLLRIINDGFTGPKVTAPALLIVTVSIYYFCTKFESAVAKQYANILFAILPLVAVHFAVRAFGGCFHTDSRERENNDASELAPAARVDATD